MPDTPKFQRFISHVNTSEIISKLFQPLKELRSYFNTISATLNMLENIHEHFEIISATEIILK